METVASVMPAPPFFHSPGDIASWVTNRSCSRPGPDSPEFQRRIEHAGGIAQQALCVVERQRLHEGLWGQPGPAAEQMVQLIRRDAGGVRHRLDGRLRAPVLRNEGDGAADQS